MNMARIAGIFVYETDVFHDLCDELGILVWQDLMFAALDYPESDPGFLSVARREAERQVRHLQSRPSLAVLSGGTDSLQQPAFFGLVAEAWKSTLFDVVLQDICGVLRPDVPYIDNSPSGAEPAYHVDQGVAHYFGVGAYRRPLEYARRSGVRFAAEALAFANIPERDLLQSWLCDAMPVAHPRWKEGVPRDSNSGWDFDDVRDHYLALLFETDPASLRSQDPERYLELSRVVTGEMMEAVLSEFRSGKTCAGALVWTWGDFRSGAGWGLVDVRGAPKAAYWMLRRALLPQAVLITDEGLNGVRIHAINDTAAPVEGEIEVTLYRGEMMSASGQAAITVPARGKAMVRGHAALKRFTDISYAFCFGPPQHDMVMARWRGADGRLLSEAVCFPAGRQRLLTLEPNLEASSEAAGPGRFLVRLRARRFAYAVSLELEPPCVPEENYFHLAPGAERTIVVQAHGSVRLRGEARPLNGAPIRIAVDAPSEEG